MQKRYCVNCVSPLTIRRPPLSPLPYVAPPRSRQCIVVLFDRHLNKTVQPSLWDEQMKRVSAIFIYAVSLKSSSTLQKKAEPSAVLAESWSSKHCHTASGNICKTRHNYFTVAKRISTVNSHWKGWKQSLTYHRNSFLSVIRFFTIATGVLLKLSYIGQPQWQLVCKNKILVSSSLFCEINRISFQYIYPFIFWFLPYHQFINSLP